MRRGEAFNFKVHHTDIVWREVWYCESLSFILETKLMRTITQRQTQIPYVKNYDFDYPQTRVSVTFTCVSGHLLAYDFDKDYRSWSSCDPFKLFDAEVKQSVAPDKQAIAANLSTEAKKCQQLMIWTDCDREGENIGAEIVSVCRKANPTIQIKRARFSAIIPQ